MVWNSKHLEKCCWNISVTAHTRGEVNRPQCRTRQFSSGFLVFSLLFIIIIIIASVTWNKNTAIGKFQWTVYFFELIHTHYAFLKDILAMRAPLAIHLVMRRHYATSGNAIGNTIQHSSHNMGTNITILVAIVRQEAFSNALSMNNINDRVIQSGIMLWILDSVFNRSFIGTPIELLVFC